MLEAQIEKKVVQWASGKGILSKKNIAGASVGWPDRLFIFPDGRHVWVEFKRQGGRLSKMQEVVIKSLRKNGVDVSVCFSVQEGLAYLEGFLDVKITE